MAGERLVKLLHANDKNPSESADIMYGKVIQVKPLKVQLANNMVIDDNFIELGKHIGKFRVQGKIKTKVEVKEHADKIGEVSGTRPTVKEEAKLDFPKKPDPSKFYLEIDNSLELDDKVTLLRCEGGQRFYLFERIDKDGYGF